MHSFSLISKSNYKVVYRVAKKDSMYSELPTPTSWNVFLVSFFIGRFQMTSVEGGGGTTTQLPWCNQATTHRVLSWRI